MIIFLSSIKLAAQNIGINATGAAPDNSAMLDVSATNKGMLVPRMTTAQRTLIASPAKGLLVFDTDNNSFWFYNGTGWVNLSAAATGSLWQMNGTNINNSNTGNVGIGTNNPLTKLTLQTPINALGFQHIGGADSIIVTEGIGGISASIGTSTFHAFRLNAGGQGRISIYPAGEVVVGPNATAPFGNLTVQTLNNSYGISHLGEGGNILATRMGGTSAGIGTFSNTNMRIFSGGVSSIFITAGTNNVGIGKDFPTYKLEVNGTIHSKEVIVDLQNWPDYVFKKNYQLPLLSDVEKFILKNNHLPNIPSAIEINEKGLQLGNTQKKMMEKIEELTLYLIEANKRIERLEKIVGEKN